MSNYTERELELMRIISKKDDRICQLEAHLRATHNELASERTRVESRNQHITELKEQIERLKMSDVIDKNCRMMYEVSFEIKRLLSKAKKERTMEVDTILKNDPITKAVDAANEILKEHNLKVGLLLAADGNTQGKSIYRDKVYYDATIKAALAAEGGK